MLKTIGWVLYTFLMFNRLGMFIGSPLFIYWRNFYQTFPFYLYLLVPLYFFIIELMHIHDVSSKKTRFIMSVIGLGIVIILSAYIVIMGKVDTMFISSLSPMMPLERLMSTPIEIVIHIASYLIISGVVILQTLLKKD